MLTALQGKPPAKETHITLNFSSDTRAGGFAGCNRYRFRYTAPGEGTIAVGMMEVTVMLCREPAGVMEQEKAYTEALRSVTAYRLEEDRLEMQNSAGDTILSFRRQESALMDPAKLVGSAWQLTLWNGRPPLEGAPITLAFTESEIHGQAGCRSYTGAYEAEGDHIRFPRLGMTEVEPQCSPALQQQEGDYTTCLGWASRYRLEGNQLTLLTERGETLLYTRAQPAPTVKPGATVRGRVIEGYGAHRPVPDLRLWLGESSEGEPAARTDYKGEFVLANVPVGETLVVNSHLIFTVTVPAGADVVDAGTLKYPLIHPPTYYWWTPAPVPSLAEILINGQVITFTVTREDSAWRRPTEEEQRAQVWSRRPFTTKLGEQDLRAWFQQPAILYDTMDLFRQSFPEGPDVDPITADRRYLLGAWTSAALADLDRAYDAATLEDLALRRQLEVWLLGYRAGEVRKLGGHFAVQVTPAAGLQIIRFPGVEGPLAVHIMQDGVEIARLP